MKRLLTFLVVILYLSAMLCGCGKIPSNNGKYTIVTTFFPEYDWVMQILGEKAEDTEVIMLLDKGTDIHCYQPTAEDIVKISTCDMFIYVGGESDKWVKDALKNAVNRGMTVISLIEALGESVKEEETAEGMQINGDTESETDEHVWLSVKNAAIFCKIIAEKLGEADGENREIYEKNAETYIEKLNTLDRNYKQTVDSSNKHTLLFGDRFPFRYLTDDYGLDYFAAFAGCSAETEASFETIVFLANKADELGLHAIIHLESSDGKIANTVRENTENKDQKIIVLDSMQSTTLEDVKNGVTYISVMEKNLEAIAEALE